MKMDEGKKSDVDLLRWVRDGATLVKQWNKLDEKVGSGIVVILQSSSSSDYPDCARNVLESISRSNPGNGTDQKNEPPEPQIVAEVAESWAKGLLPILHEIQEKGHTGLIKESLRIPGHQTFYIDFMTKAVQLAPATELLSCLAPSAEPQLIIEDITTACKNGLVKGSVAIAVREIIGIGEAWDWGNLTKSLREQLDVANTLEPDEIEGCISSLLKLSYDDISDQASSFLKELSTGGHLLHHLNKASTAESKVAAANCVLLLLELNPQGALPDPPPGSSASGLNYYNSLLANPLSDQSVLNEFNNLIIKYDKIEWLFKIPEGADNAKNFSVAALELIAQRVDAYAYIGPSQFTSNYSFLAREFSNDAIGGLVQQLLDGAQLIQFLVRMGFSDELAGLYLLIFHSIDYKDAASFVDFITNGLRSVNDATWSKEISSEGQLLELVIELVKYDVGLDLSSSIHDALLVHARGLLRGQAPPSRLNDEWSLILNGLSDHSRETFLRNLRDELLVNRDVHIASVLSLYGKHLLDEEVLEEKADGFVRTVLSGILDRGDTEEIVWLRRAVSNSPDIFEKAESSSKKAFADKLKVFHSELSPEADIVSDIEQLAQTLGIGLETGLEDVEEQSKENTSGPENASGTSE